MSLKPLVTIFLFAYNNERFIAEAVNSILSQTYQPLQILISDDCSNDNTFSMATELAEKYHGPHKIIFNQNDKNLGIGRHINRIMELAEGELLVEADGDDISLPDRVSEIVDMWLSSGKKYRAMCSENLVIDETGEFAYKMPKVKPVTFGRVLQPGGPWIYGSSLAWHRSLFQIFGSLHEKVVSQDKAIGFRSLLLGQEIGYIDKPLVKYRSHVGNVTSGSTNLATLQQKISTYKSYVEDFNKARALGYLHGRDDLEKFHRELTEIQSDFILRHKILSSGLIKATILLMTCGDKLSIQQKKNIFLKKFKGQEKKVGW